jgi:hypothetical protein
MAEPLQQGNANQITADDVKKITRQAIEQQNKKRSRIRSYFTDPQHGLSQEDNARIDQITRLNPEEKLGYFNAELLSNATGLTLDRVLLQQRELQEAYSEKYFGESIESEFDFFNRVRENFQLEEKAAAAAQRSALSTTDSVTSRAKFLDENKDDPVFQGSKDRILKFYDDNFDASSADLGEYRPLIRTAAQMLTDQMGVTDGDMGDFEDEDFVRMIMEVDEDKRMSVLQAIGEVAEEGEDKNIFKRIGERFGRYIGDKLRTSNTNKRQRNIEAAEKVALRGGIDASDFPDELGFDPGSNPEVIKELAKGVMFQSQRIASQSAVGKKLGDFTESLFDVKVPKLGTKEFEALSPSVQETLKRLDEEKKFLNLYHDINQLATQVIDPAEPNTTKEENPAAFYTAKAVLGLASSAPDLIMMANPILRAVNIKTFSDRSTLDIMRSNPGMSASDATQLGTTAGVFQHLLQYIPFQVITGRTPFLGRLLKNPTLTKRRRAANALTRLTVGTTLEFGQEFAQDMAPWVVQSIAAALKKDVPNVNWEEKLSVFASEENLEELIPTIVLMNLIGAGVGSWRDYALTKGLMFSTDVMVASGLTEAEALEVDALQKEGKLDEAQAILRKGLKREEGKKTKTPNTRLADALKLQKKEIDKRSKIIEEGEELGFIPTTIKTQNGWGLRFADESVVEFQTYAELENAREKHLQDKFLDLHEEIKATISQVEKDVEAGRELTYLIKPFERNMLQVVEEGEETRERALNRLDIAKEQTGQSLQNDLETEYNIARNTADLEGMTDDERLANARILGKNVTEFAKGIAKTTSTLYQGFSPITIIEEKSEGDAAVLLQDGKRDWLISKIRGYEEVSGDKVFISGKADEDLTNGDIKEAYSALVQSYFVGRTKKGEVLGRAEKDSEGKAKNARQKYADIMRAGLGSTMGAYAQFFRSIWRRAAKLNKLRREGKLDAELEQELARSVGMSDQGQYEADVLTEAEKFKEELEEDGVELEVEESKVEPTDDVSFSVINQKSSLRLKMTRAQIIEAVEASSDWKDFYERHEELLREYFGPDHKLFQRLLSATSQAASVKANVSLALKAYGQLKRGEEFVGYLAPVIGNLEKIRNDSKKLNGRKIGNYEEASSGDKSKVVVDRHVARMLFGVTSPTKAQFEKAEKVLTEIANLIGWEPREVQAAIWAASIRKSGNEPESYDQYLKRLKREGSLERRIGFPLPRSGGDSTQRAGRGSDSGSSNVSGDRSGLEAGGPLTEAESRDEVGFSVIQSTEYLRNDDRFDDLLKEGKIKPDQSIDNFVGQNILLHAPDNAFSGKVIFEDGQELEGKGGVFYPALFADLNYFWASTQAVAEKTANHLNEIGRKNGGRILMGLVSAPVGKLFSSTTMSRGVVRFFEALADQPRKTGVTKSKLNSMIVKASKVSITDDKGKVNKFRDNPLAVKDGLAANIDRMDGLLDPENAVFAVRKAFVQSLIKQLTDEIGTAKAKADPKIMKQARFVADKLHGDHNPYAAATLAKGELSVANLTQGLGNLLTEPFLRDFQEGNQNGMIYAVIEAQGEVEAIESDHHESYPFAIVPKNRESKVVLHTMKEAFDWQKVVGHETSGFGDVELIDPKTKKPYTKSFEKARKNLFPTSGMSSTTLKVMPGSETRESGKQLSFSVIENAEERIADMFSPFQRSPVLRHEVGARAHKKILDLYAKFRPVFEANRTPKEINEAARKVEEEKLSELLEGISPATVGALELSDSLDDTAQRPILAELTTYRTITRKDGIQVRMPGGSIMGKTRAKAEGRSTAEYNDMPEGLPSYVFGGNLSPDQAAKIAGFDDVAEFFSALDSEIKSFNDQKEAAAAARREVAGMSREAREAGQARKAELLKEKKTVGSDKKTLLGALRMLDAVVSSLPMEIRGKVGGVTAIAKRSSPEAMLKEIERRVKRADQELEYYLYKEADAALDDPKNGILARIQKTKVTEAGKKYKGRLGQSFYTLVDAAKEARNLLTLEQGEAEAQKAEIDIASIEEINFDTLSEEKKQQLMEDSVRAGLLAEIYRAFAGWRDRDATQRHDAVKMLNDLYNGAWINALESEAEKRERYEALRGEAIDSTNADSSAKSRKKKKNEVKGKRKGILGFQPWDFVVSYLFGEDSEIAIYLADGQRKAENDLTDAMQAIYDDFEAYVKENIESDDVKSAKILTKLDEPTIETDEGIYSELDAVDILLTWDQEDGRRHMEGHKDEETGKPNGDWHYGEEFVKQIEKGLSDTGRMILSFLQSRYSQEYDRLNKLYRKQNGVDMPKNKFYAPISVIPIQSSEGDNTDPTTGMQLSRNNTPGALRTRGGFIAEPDFQNGLEKYFSHKRQMEHWLAFSEFSQEANAVLGNRKVRNAISAKAGQESINTIVEWTTMFTEGGVRAAGVHLGFNKFIREVGGNFAIMALWGRLGTIAIQVTQLAAGNVVMSSYQYNTRLFKLFAGQLGWGVAINSDYIKRRLREQPVMVRELMNDLGKSKPTKVKFNAQKVGKLIGGADALFTAGTFAIVYDHRLQKALERGLERGEAEAFALNEAERVTDRLAQPTRSGARSIIENTTVNPLAKISWVFGSEARKNISLMIQAKLQNGVWSKEMGRATMFAIVANALIAAIIRNSWRDLRDDEDDEIFDPKHWRMKKIIASVLTDWMYGVPVLGEEVQNAVLALLGETQPQGTAFSAIPKAAYAVKNLHKIEDVDDLMRSTETIMTALGLFNDQTAAAAVFMHPMRDGVDIITNLIDN